MQGPRGPGLLMGIGRAKLVPPPVRKFAPSLKPQAPKIVVAAPPPEEANVAVIASDLSADQQAVQNAPEQESALIQDANKSKANDTPMTANDHLEVSSISQKNVPQKTGTADTASVTRSA
jgi:hypothetical protein